MIGVEETKAKQTALKHYSVLTTSALRWHTEKNSFSYVASTVWQPLDDDL